ncbi:MAG: tyrosine-type recombinase/integrase [Hydrogeniiclostridium mannosilyticum]
MHSAKISQDFGCLWIGKRNFHVLRHTFATRCVEAKIDIKTLSEILGHSSVTITMNRYVHPSLELKRETMEQLADFISVK